MLTRYQARGELYNQVLDEPNMLACILQHLRDPADIVHLKSICCPRKPSMTRFHDTIHIALLEKQEDFIKKKLGNFARQVTVYVNQVLSIPGDNRQSLDNLFEFLLENMWYQKNTNLQSFNRTIEQRLVELALDERYSHNALHYLGLLYNIHVRGIMIEDDEVVEYIIDSNGNSYFI